jgi:hypothetical protein
MSCILPVCITFFWNGNRLAGVMVSISASSTYIVGSSPGGINPKTITLLCVASPLSRQRYGVRTKTDWLGNKIECSSGVTCLPVETIVSGSLHYKGPTCWYSTRRTSSLSSHRK